jgi:hypothetical protein
LDPPQTKVTLGQLVSRPVEFHLGNATEDGKYRYARVAGEPELYAMPAVRAQRIIDLALKPPYPPEPP